MNREWQSMHDVIDKDRHRKSGSKYLDAVRHGESTSAQYIKPKQTFRYEEYKNTLYVKMKYGKFYETSELCKILGISNKHNLSRDLRYYPELFECVGKGVWRLKE